MSMTAEAQHWSISAELVIDSTDLSAMQLTEAIGLTPDESWEAGALRGSHSPIRYKTNGISYRARSSGFNITDAALEPLRQRLEPRIDAVRDVHAGLIDRASGGARLWISLTTDVADPMVTISSDMLAFWSRANLPLEVSILVMAKDEADGQ